jgi:hypothetical protein
MTVTAAVEPVGDGSLREEPGPLLFARFALPPNRLGYCGGEEAASLLQHVAAGVVDGDLIRDCRGFEGAFPYLSLIAAASGIADPLDRAIVDAYWLGGTALRNVSVPEFAAHIDRRFRPRTGSGEWRWLADKPVRGAVPHHSFHVLEVLPRIGLLRGGMPTALVPVLEQCLVRPARVLSVDGEMLRIAATRLVLDHGELRLIETGDEESVAWAAGANRLIQDPRPGDHVAIHWGWACKRVSSAVADRLVRVTRAAAARAGTTL